MNKSYQICITVDYELFGDGSGDLVEHVIEPTDRFLDFLESKGIKATFFVEAAELLVFRRSLGKNGSGTLPGLQEELGKIELQIMSMLRRGHDVQLHIHPQWFGAKWDGSSWRFETAHRSLLSRGRHVLASWLREGKEYLERVCRLEKSDYECNIFRAGGLHLDGGSDVIELLLDLGFKMDSSVCRYYHRINSYSNIDYRGISETEKPYWYTENGRDILDGPTDRAIIEVPIWSIPRRQLYKLSPRRLHAKLSARWKRRGLKSRGSVYSPLPWGLLSKTKWLFEKQAMIWDFCLLSAQELYASFQAAMAYHRGASYIPLVMLGHSKEMADFASLDGFARALEAKRIPVNWATLSDVLRKIGASEAS